MSKQSPMDELKAIADACGKSVRDIRQIVMQVYVDDENFAKRALTAKQHHIQDLQMNLMRLQTNNESMREVMLQAKLRRSVWRETKYSQFKKFINGLTCRKRKDQ